MASLLTTIPTPAFPPQLDTLSLSLAQGEECAVTISLTQAGAEAEELLATTLTGGADGTAEISDLASLLSDSLTTDAATLTITLDGAEAATATLMPCRAWAAGGAASWCATRALSLATGQRATTYGSTEYVSVARLREESFIFTLTIILPDGTQAAKTLTSGTAASGVIETVRWKWSDYADDIPSAYRNTFCAALTATTNGGQSVAFRYCAMTRPFGAQELRYRNAFGQWETLLFASVTTKHKPTRTAAVFNGEYRNYLIENATTYEGVTVALPDGQVAQAADFLEASTVERVTDGAALALTDGELEEESGPAAMPRLSATWRETTRSPRPATAATSIFDESFDDSFE